LITLLSEIGYDFQIIKNTELKSDYDESKLLDEFPVRFEFFIMSEEILDMLISSMKKYLDVGPELIKKDLRKVGFNEQQIPKQLNKLIKKQEEDRLSYNFLLQNNNNLISYNEKNSKITGFWSQDEKDYNYHFNISKKIK